MSHINHLLVLQMNDMKDRPALEFNSNVSLNITASALYAELLELTY